MTLADLKNKLSKANAKLAKATHGLRISERRIRHFKKRAAYFHEKGFARDEARATKNLHRWLKRQTWLHDKKTFLTRLVARRKAKIAKWKREHKHVYGAGGWAPTATWWEQRVDQGQDFEIPLGQHVRAPGDGEILAIGYDNPFPYGFGKHLIVRIDNGPFGGREYYIGHAEGGVNEGSLVPGHKFKKGDLLSATNHYLNVGRGWVELGTYPYGPMGTGWNIHSLFHDITE